IAVLRVQYAGAWKKYQTLEFPRSSTFRFALLVSQKKKTALSSFSYDKGRLEQNSLTN
ncbi:hypothetical protein XENOCAPTIV_030865, partial [Xenoophorus captivus]